MTKKNNKITGVLLGVTALGAFAFTAAPAFAASTTEGWHEVVVTTSQELTLTGSKSEEITVTPTATGGADSEAGGALGVRANVGWKLQWQAVQEEYTDESTVAATGTYLTATGFGTTATNAALAYQGTNAEASGDNVWSAQLVAAGTNQTLAFTALTTALGTIQTGTATTNASLTPTYSADVDATLTSGTYYGTIYYKLSTN
jgi:hypothetical protein